VIEAATVVTRSAESGWDGLRPRNSAISTGLTYSAWRPRKKPITLSVTCRVSPEEDLVTSIGWAGMTLTRRTHGCGPGLGTGSAAEVSVPTFWFLHGDGWTTHSPQGKRIASHGLSPSYPEEAVVPLPDGILTLAATTSGLSVNLTRDTKCNRHTNTFRLEVSKLKVPFLNESVTNKW